MLSGAEEAGLFSKLERAGAFSSAEKLLPIADDLKLLSTAEKLLEIPSFALVVGAGGLVGGGEHAYTCCAATVGGGGLLFAPWRFSAAASTVRVSAHPLTLRLAVFSVRRARPDQRAAG